MKHWAFWRPKTLQPKPQMVMAPPMRAIFNSEDRTKEAVYYEAMSKRLEHQFQSVETLDAKIATWYQSASLVVTILTTILVAEKPNVTIWFSLSTGIGFSLFLGGIFTLYFAQRSVFLYEGTKWQEFAINVKNARVPLDDLYYEMGYRLGERYLPSNNKVLARKIKFLDVAVALFFVSILLLIAAIVIGALYRGASPRHELPVPVPDNPRLVAWLFLTALA